MQHPDLIFPDLPETKSQVVGGSPRLMVLSYDPSPRNVLPLTSYSQVIINSVPQLEMEYTESSGRQKH